MKIETLFSEFTITKLDYSQNPNNISDEILVGPICNCNDYKKAKSSIDDKQLDFSSMLIH